MDRVEQGRSVEDSLVHTTAAKGVGRVKGLLLASGTDTGVEVVGVVVIVRHDGRVVDERDDLFLESYKVNSAM